MPDPAPRSHDPMSRRLHWLVAAAVIPMIAAGLVMTTEGLPRALGNALFLFHKNLGTLLIPVILLRLIWRWTHPAPPLPAWKRLAARLSHGLLYALLVILPLSGFIRVRAGGFPIEMLDAVGAGAWLPRSDALAGAAQALHQAAAFTLIVALAVHIAAAAHHGLVRRDGVWRRMWPARRS